MQQPTEQPWGGHWLTSGLSGGLGQAGQKGDHLNPPSSLTLLLLPRREFPFPPKRLSVSKQSHTFRSIPFACFLCSYLLPHMHCLPGLFLHVVSENSSQQICQYEIHITPSPCACYAASQSMKKTRSPAHLAPLSHPAYTCSKLSPKGHNQCSSPLQLPWTPGSRSPFGMMESPIIRASWACIINNTWVILHSLQEFHGKSDTRWCVAGVLWVCCSLPVHASCHFYLAAQQNEDWKVEGAGLQLKDKTLVLGTHRTGLPHQATAKGQWEENKW